MNSPQHYYKKGVLIIVFLFVCATFTPLSYTLQVQNAHAQLGPITLTGGINVQDISTELSNTLQQISSAALENKAFVLDPLFYQIAQQALQQMVNNILSFVNSGFDGNPAFVTDLGQHLQDVSDKTATNFFYSDQLSTACTPFKLDEVMNLPEEYQKKNSDFKTQASCTIDEPGVDQKAFLNGNFSAGGWAIWFEAISHPADTGVGYDLAAHAALNDAIAEQQNIELTKLNWSNGFLSKESCATVDSTTGEKSNCTVTTPGALIKDQASFALQIPALSLLNADSFNESVGNLFSNLANQALSGVNGLLGLGGSSANTNNSFGASGNLSYLDAITQEGSQSAQASTGINGNQIQQALVTENKVLQLQISINAAINDDVTLFDDTRKPYASSSCWKLQIPSELSAALNDLLKQVPKTASTVLTLNKLSDQYDQANSTSAQLQTLQQFATLQSNGSIGGQAAVVKYDYFLNTTLKQLTDQFKKDIATQKNSCS